MIQLRKRLCLLVLLVPLMYSLSAAGRGEESVSTSDDLIEVTIEIFDRSKVPESEGTITDNRWTNWAREQMLERGVKLNYFPVPRSEEVAKLNMLMAAGTAPDMVFTYDTVLFAQYAADGGLHDLTDLIPQYGPNIQKIVGAPGYLKDYGTIDDKVYAIPAIRDFTAIYNAYIRNDWLEKLNLEVPRTKEELLTVLKAFRDADPSLLGTKRVIPWGYQLGSSTQPDRNLVYSFFEPDIELDYSTPNQYREGYKDAVRFMNTVYNENLLDPDFSTLTTEQYLQQFLNGDFGFLSVGWWRLTWPNYEEDYHLLKQLQPDTDYKAISVFENTYNGEYYKMHYPPTGILMMVPKSSKHPEGVIKYLNWMAEEDVAKTIFYGFENEHYRMEDGLPHVIDEEFFASNLGYIQYDLLMLFNGVPIMLDQKLYEQKVRLRATPILEDFAVDADRISREGIPFRDPVFNVTIKSQTEHNAEINLVHEEFYSKLIMAKPDEFDALFDKYIQALEARNIKAIVAERQAYYDSYIKD